MAGLDDHSDGADVRVADVDSTGTLTMTIAGEIDLAGLPALQESIDQVIEQHPRVVVFDLTDVAFMDSSGIALLLKVAQQVEAVRVPNPSQIVRRVIELSGLSATLPMTS